MVKSFTELNIYKNSDDDSIYSIHTKEYPGYFVTDVNKIVDLAKAWCSDNGIEAVNFKLVIKHKKYDIFVTYNNTSKYNNKKLYSIQVDRIYSISKWKKENKIKEFNI